MSDPDGVDGNKQETATVRTRPEPKPFADGRVFHAYPAGYKGSKEKEAFTGIAGAFGRAEPGDTILVHAGVYQIDRTQYNLRMRIGMGSDVFWNDLVYQERHARQAYCNKGRGRWRGHFRWGRLLHPLRCQWGK